MLDKKRNALGPWWQLLPAGGICAYFALYVVAAALYSGGSQADKASVGFSWLHNYWCNLLNTDAINGQPNAARPVALAAMGVLCSFLIVFCVTCLNFLSSAQPAYHQWYQQVSFSLSTMI